MNFKKRKIRNNLIKFQKSKPSSDQSEKKNSAHQGGNEGQTFLKNPRNLKTIVLSSDIILLVVLVFLFINILKSLDFSSVIFSFGKNLETDAFNKTNILLLGIGGEGHDGANLTDTIILMSIDTDKKKIKMLSFPRDMYIKDKNEGGGRINKVYDTYLNKYSSTQGLEAIKNVVSEISGTKIQYAVKVDFKGFVKIIDSLGGLDVVVEKDIYDPEYPKDGTIYYEPFSLKAGQQHLDGKTALKYARSRHGNSGADFGRAKRQQQLLGAMKEKALNLNLLSDVDKIQSLYNSLNESIETDLSVTEIITLAKTMKDFNKDNIETRLLSDDPTSCGGFLYQPPREQFGNAYVLLPAGNNYDAIHTMVHHYFNNEALNEQNSPIQVLNGTKTNGLAFVALNILSRYCMNTIYYGNAQTKNIETTQIYYQPNEKGEKPEALNLITTFIPAPVSAGIPPVYLENEKGASATIVIELGKDYLTIRPPDPFDSIIAQPISKPTNTTTNTSNTTSATQQTGGNTSNPNNN